MLNFQEASAAETRTVAQTIADGEPARLVSCAKSFASSLPVLWQAVSDPGHIAKWFAPVSGDLKKGGDYQVEGNASGTILQCRPQDVISVTWKYAGNISWVELIFTENEIGSSLTLSHTMRMDPESEKHWEQYGPGATGVGWDLSFLGLALHLQNDGADVAGEETETWLGSPAGKRLIASCTEAWCEAHILSGEDPEIAARMADETLRAYTGT